MSAPRELSTHEALEQLRSLEQALDASATCVWHTDVLTGGVLLSRSWSAMLGGPSEETRTTVQELAALVHPEDVEPLRQIQLEAVRGVRSHYAAEHRVRMRNGEWKWIHSSGNVTVRDPATGYALQMSGTNTDITEIRRLREALQRSEAERQQILDSVPVEIAHVDHSERITFANQAYLARRNLTESQVVGNTVRGVTGDARYAELKPRIDRALAGHGDAFELTSQPRDRIGRELFVQYIPDRPGSGGPGGFLYLAIDVTERNRTARALQIAKSSAEQANRAKSEFLSSMSHELRTPLGTILGFGQLLQEAASGFASDQQRQWLGSMVKAGWHLLGLVNDVLDLARIEAGRIELSLQAVALDDLIDEVQREISPLASKREVSLQIETGLTRYAHADPMRLRQVLLNILSNAVKYNSTGGTVTVATRAAPDFLAIDVSDTGPGIAPDKLGELFKPFKRIGAERSGVEGYGLGLSIAQNLVQLMGGRIMVRSEIGSGTTRSGTTFTVEIPLARQEHTQIEGARVDVGHGQSDMLSRVSATILCVEDDIANQRLVQAVISRWKGLRLLLAQDGRQGLDLALQARPDLILLDIDLPGMNGYDILRALRERADMRQIPVIGISARAMPPDMDRASGASFHAYLTKPYQISDLQASLESALAPLQVRA